VEAEQELKFKKTVH